MKTNYKAWPIGLVPKEWQRPELDMLKEHGYALSEPREAVTIFERKMAEYAGSQYAIAVDNCTDAVFLCLQYLKHTGQLKDGDEITIPKRCYLSIPMVIKLCGLKIIFEDIQWSGIFQLKPTPVYDGAVRFTEGMYVPDSLYTTSFQIKKQLPIGKGGMIFTNNKEAEWWFRRASFEGRNLEIDQWSDPLEIMGWNMYMTPEDAARGILIFDHLPKINKDSCTQDSYPDLSKKEIFKNG